jgi:hypothetical protein
VNPKIDFTLSIELNGKDVAILRYPLFAGQTLVLQPSLLRTQLHLVGEAYRTRKTADLLGWDDIGHLLKIPASTPSPHLLVELPRIEERNSIAVDSDRGVSSQVEATNVAPTVVVGAEVTENGAIILKRMNE